MVQGQKKVAGPVRRKKFTVITGQLYKKGINQVLRRCVPKHEKMGILQEAHQGIAGGHLEKEAIVRKVLQAELWWPPPLAKIHTCSQSIAMYARD